MHRKLWLLPMTALLVAMLAFGAACGDDDDGDDDALNGDSTPVGGAAGATSEPTTADATSEATSSGGGTTPAAGGDEGAITISADNAESFSTDELTAPSGSVTIVFENEDDGVTHNFALYDSEDSAEELIDATDLLPGPSTDEITVDLEPGTYYYNCQVHPQMEGTLTVE